MVALFYAVLLMILQRSQIDGSPPKPSVPLSWRQPSTLTRSNSSFSDATEAQRLLRGFTLYLRDIENDKDAFDLGEYNTLERGQGVRPISLTTQCKDLMDRMLEATHGKIRSKQSVQAAIQEMLRTHPKRNLLGSLEKGKFSSWLRIRVYTLIDHARKLKKLSQFLIDSCDDAHLEIMNGWVAQLQQWQVSGTAAEMASPCSSLRTTPATSCEPQPRPSRRSLSDLEVATMFLSVP